MYTVPLGIYLDRVLSLCFHMGVSVFTCKLSGDTVGWQFEDHTFGSLALELPDANLSLFPSFIMSIIMCQALLSSVQSYLICWGAGASCFTSLNLQLFFCKTWLMHLIFQGCWKITSITTATTKSDSHLLTPSSVLCVLQALSLLVIPSIFHER